MLLTHLSNFRRLAHLANDIPRRVGDVAWAACNVARAACEVACATAAIDVARDGCDVARDAARVSARVANLAAHIADSVAMFDVNASAESEASVAANLARSFANHADYVADAFSTLIAPRSCPAIRCSGIFRDKLSFNFLITWPRLFCFVQIFILHINLGAPESWWMVIRIRIKEISGSRSAYSNSEIYVVQNHTLGHCMPPVMRALRAMIMSRIVQVPMPI